MSIKDIFDLFGPVHLTTVDWTNSGDRRSVAASLVRSVRVLEKDREFNRQTQLAPPWWKAFHFELYRKLTDDVDSSIFGAIYQLCSTSQTAPRYVVAFRGTILKGHATKRDLKLNAALIRNELHQTSRFQSAIQAVRDVVETHDDVWVAGHSLGAAIALLAGKGVAAASGILLHNTFLFNPPFPSLPMDRMIFRSEKKKFSFRAATTVFKAGVAMILEMEDHRGGGAFAALDTWRPLLFVNPKDLICAGYVRYFEDRQRMADVGGGEIERTAAPYSLVGLVSYALGKEWTEPMHLIPSARVTVNRNPSGYREAHGIHQWWEPHLHMKTTTYTYTKIDDDDDDDDDHHHHHKSNPDHAAKSVTDP